MLQRLGCCKHRAQSVDAESPPQVVSVVVHDNYQSPVDVGSTNALELDTCDAEEFDIGYKSTKNLDQTGGTLEEKPSQEDETQHVADMSCEKAQCQGVDDAHGEVAQAEVASDSSLTIPSNGEGVAMRNSAPEITFLAGSESQENAESIVGDQANDDDDDGVGGGEEHEAGTSSHPSQAVGDTSAYTKCYDSGAQDRDKIDKRSRDRRKDIIETKSSKESASRQKGGEYDRDQRRERDHDRDRTRNRDRDRDYDCESYRERGHDRHDSNSRREYDSRQDRDRTYDHDSRRDRGFERRDYASTREYDSRRDRDRDRTRDRDRGRERDRRQRSRSRSYRRR